MLPWLLTHAGVSNHAEAGGVPDTVHYSFYAGAIVLFAAHRDNAFDVIAGQ